MPTMVTTNSATETRETIEQVHAELYNVTTEQSLWNAQTQTKIGEFSLALSNWEAMMKSISATIALDLHSKGLIR